ncbi:hypothetical protein NDU88_006497 [Pleurodeles waltl]|uniref:Uncharacterized protein n=1 Tax=Pleurodeles waltl TaxID=8319 RepID=A0AAV7SPP9_PLEWA|nr:hypothetical protein NDU88_006497 [Pleurodeles waltl]
MDCDCSRAASTSLQIGGCFPYVHGMKAAAETQEALRHTCAIRQFTTLSGCDQTGSPVEILAAPLFGSAIMDYQSAKMRGLDARFLP